MRFLLMAWTLIMFVLTCTSDPYNLLEGKVAFVMNPDPHWSQLFMLEAWHNISWIEFAGHFSMFFILTCILAGVFKKVTRAVAVALLYSIITELVQPFFGRGAEGIDLLANLVGMIFAVVLYALLENGARSKKHGELGVVKRIEMENRGESEHG